MSKQFEWKELTTLLGALLAIKYITGYRIMTISIHMLGTTLLKDDNFFVIVHGTLKNDNYFVIVHRKSVSYEWDSIKVKM